jgi:dolichol-phosphate mannosyltransferase
VKEAGTTKPIVLSILVPVRNEGLNVRVMLKVLRAVVEVPHEVLVVHDEADDDAVAVVASMSADFPRLRTLHNTLGAGVINAIRAGVEAAAGDIILIFAADEVGPVLAIDDMLKLMEGGCDFVSCTRYAHGGRRLGGSLIGGVLSRLANRLFHALAGSVLTDSTTGIKMFRRVHFGDFDLHSRPIGWAVAFEMAIKAQIMGLRLGEVPIVSIDRLFGGESTFRLGSWTMEYLRWFLWGMKHLHRAPKAGLRGQVMVQLPMADDHGRQLPPR